MRKPSPGSGHRSRLLVYSIGSLGDTLLCIPALRVLRSAFPEHVFVLLTNRDSHGNRVPSSDILLPGGLCDEVVAYDVIHGPAGYARNALSMVGLLRSLREQRFEALAYLVERFEEDPQVLRDRIFFRLAGIRTFIGMRGLQDAPVGRGLDIPRVEHRVDELLARLAASGLAVPAKGSGDLDLGLTEGEKSSFEAWARELPAESRIPWLAIGPGSKMPAKVWPSDRYAEAVARLLASHDLWPVVFGGLEDRSVGEALVKYWKRGSVAAGSLGVRVSAVGLSRCTLYLGNDTGTMHLAAAVGTPCVALFSAREPAGRWDPYGAGHQVLRAQIDCAGCKLEVCDTRANECLRLISVDDVVQASMTVLRRRLGDASLPTPENRRGRT